jgi:MFS transporter, DHA1 family, inner membrane transport protein
MSWKERMILFILAALNFTHILDFMIMMPLGNFLMPHFSISPRFFSWIVAAYPITAFCSGMVAAFFVDRFDRKRVLLFAYCGFLIGTICCGLAPDPVFLMASRILTGLFGGLIGAQVLSIVADTFPYEKRGRAMSSIFMAFSVASIFGVPFSLYLAKIISWHAPFIFIGILGVLIIPLIAKYLPPIREHLASVEKERKTVPEVLRSIMNNKSQVNALLFTGMLMLGHFMIIPFINPFMEFNNGFTKTQTPLIYMVGGVSALITSFFIGRLADRYGKFRVFLIAVICSLFPIVIITNLPSFPLVVVLSIFGFWFAASTSRNIPAQAMISTVVEPAQRGQFMSFNASFQQLFTGLASIIAGLIVVQDRGGKIIHYNWVGYVSVAIVASTIYIGYKLARKQKLN